MSSYIQNYLDDVHRKYLEYLNQNIFDTVILKHPVQCIILICEQPFRRGKWVDEAKKRKICLIKLIMIKFLEEYKIPDMAE